MVLETHRPVTQNRDTNRLGLRNGPVRVASLISRRGSSVAGGREGGLLSEWCGQLFVRGEKLTVRDRAQTAARPQASSLEGD